MYYAALCVRSCCDSYVAPVLLLPMCVRVHECYRVGRDVLAETLVHTKCLGA